jgi:hypothetical protein
MSSTTFLTAVSIGAMLIVAPLTRAANEDTKNVVVVNPPAAPVPVQQVGTATVTGNVNVGNVPTVTVGNTPGVNVVNTPTVNVSTLPPVEVNNSAGNPVRTKEVGQAGTKIFSTRLVFDKADWAGSTLACKTLEPVPQDQILVIEFITGNLETTDLKQKMSFLVTPTPSKNGVIFPIVGALFDDGFSDLNLTQVVKIYSDDHVAGPKVCISSTDPSSISNKGGVSLSGYFLDTN